MFVSLAQFYIVLTFKAVAKFTVYRVLLSDDNSNSDDSELPLDVIIGSSVGGLIFIIIVCVIVYKVRTRHRISFP